MAEEGDPVSLTPGALRLRWDVFLSFRGEDTRHTFTKDLYLSLENQGVRVFRDDDGLRRGDEIAAGLLSAIEDSAASIVIVSRRYANSHWCLKELVKICELRRLILPIFYRVNPADFRRQTGTFGEDLRRHEERFPADTISEWKRAMEKVGALDGWPITVDSEEGKIVESLANRVLNELGNLPVNAAANKLIGLDYQVEELMQKMDVTSNGVRVLGLHGKSGVGKTTLAEILYKKLATHFQFHSFLQNVREISGKPFGLASLQTKLIADLSPPNMPHATEFKARIDAIRWIFHENRVLVIFDDVDAESQLEMLLGNRLWFQEGSRIIITTISESNTFLRDYVDEFYEVKELDSPEAIKLFSYQALRRDIPTGCFFRISDEIVTIIGGLPLALIVCASILYEKRRIKEWEAIVKKLKGFQTCNLQNVVKISIDSLDPEERSIFLDISCLFVEMEMKREDVVGILNACGFSGELAVRNLVSKSLVKITENDTLWMHNQIRDVGRQMVREENLENSGMRSRLWECDEILAILKNNKGTRSIQAITLDFQQRETVDILNEDADCRDHLMKKFGLLPPFTYLKEIFKRFLKNKVEKPQEAIRCSKAFDKMLNLRLLQMNNVVLGRKFKYFPVKLKWLKWKGCRLKAFPSDYCPQELAVLDLSESTIQRLSGQYSDKVSKKLLVINLRGCHNLAAIPDLSGLKELRHVVLEDCSQLTRIHESIGNMTSLLHLNLKDCSNLIELPIDLTGLKHLESLILSGCMRLRDIPESICSMRSLIELLADETAVSSLPDSIFHLTKLEKLSLNCCRLLKRLPQSIGKLCSLKDLSLDGSAIDELPDFLGSLENIEKLSLKRCESLKKIPNTIGSFKLMTELLIDGSAIEELPDSVGALSNLKILSLGKCHDLRRLPDSIARLMTLVELRLDETSITSLPENIGDLLLLRKLEMKRCRDLRSLPKSIGSMSLTSLNMLESNITELPESLGRLENLRTLVLGKCKLLSKLPTTIGGLKSLHHLFMEETSVSELPESLGKLSNLRRLKLAKNHRDEVPEQSDHAHAASCSSNSNFAGFSASLSNLPLLSELDASGWKSSSTIVHNFEKLTSLEILNLGRNSFTSLPPTLVNLSSLKKLILPHCNELHSLPTLPSSLLELNLANCTALESMPDISDLENMQELNLTNCDKLVDVLGLECLKSLRRLYLGGCCNAFLSFVKGRLLKLSLKNLCKLSMPGCRIPDWFSKNLVRVSDSENRQTKGIIFYVVVSNLQMLNGFSNLVPEALHIQIEVLRSQKQIYSETLPLVERPKLREDQVHLYQFPFYHPLVTKLKNGYRIQANVKDAASVKMVELKKFGFHLVYEDDYAYPAGEGTLDGSTLGNLTKFLFEGDESAAGHARR